MVVAHPIRSTVHCSWPGLCAAKPDEDVAPARLAPSLEMNATRRLARAAFRSRRRERDMSSEQRLREPGPPLRRLSPKREHAFQPGCARREIRSVRMPLPTVPRTSMLATPPGAASRSTSVIASRRAARLQYDSDRPSAGSGSVGDFANYAFRRIAAEQHRMRLEKTRDVSVPISRDAGRPAHFERGVIS